jgi:putative ABC transport system permease protein
MMPLSTAKVRVLGRGLVKPRSVHAILVKVYAHHVMADAEREIRCLLRQRHRLLLRKDDDFTVQNLTELMETRKEAFRQFTLLVAVLASVSLIVGGIGIMNIMLVSVTERTRENGLRLAVGARPRDLGNQYLTEAVTLSLIGGLLGVAVGLGTASVITRLVDWPTLFRPGVMIMAIGFSVAVGLLFGLYPALKASRLNPIEALRLE